MSWNYRVCRYTVKGETLFGIREVYYDENGTMNGIGAASVDDWTSVEEVRGTLNLMRRALKLPVLRLKDE